VAKKDWQEYNIELERIYQYAKLSRIENATTMSNEEEACCRKLSHKTEEVFKR
jgi:hypothetical protein